MQSLREAFTFPEGEAMRELHGSEKLGATTGRVTAHTDVTGE
jgi:hypothetical protein